MKKRILSILLTLCMTLCLTPISVFAEEVGTEGSAAIQLGTDALSVLSKNVNTATAPIVYFGQNHENNPTAWRVIGYDGSGVTSSKGDITLLAADAMGVIPFVDTILNNEYAPSNLKATIDALAEKLTTEENAAVKKRALTSGSYDGENTDCVAGGQVDNAVFWPLSTAEAFAVNNDLRALEPAHPNWVDRGWWLRSPGSDKIRLAVVRSDGSVQYSGFSVLIFNNHRTVRPAFNLNLNSVLFASAAVGGKPDGGLTEVSKYSGNEWKLTLLDSRRNFAVTEKTVSAVPDDTVTLNYKGATRGKNEYISVILADNNGAQYYGRVAQPTAKSGTVEIKIPSDIAPGDYTMKVFSEQYNGDCKTDLASAFADVTLTVESQPDEQFTLAPGGRYYFDLSAMNIPGTVNSNLPDSTLHYVPFTYVGTVNAYKLTSEMATTEEYAQKNKYPHSLFIADYAVTHTVSWDDLNTADLIFGKNYASGGVDYTLRAPSVGSNYTGSGNSERGVPQSNEWDTMLNKDSGYIQNWNEMYSWGQDTVSVDASLRAIRGYTSARYWSSTTATNSYPDVGFRPVLEVLNPDTLGPGGLKVVTLDLGGGKLGGSSEDIQIIVKNGESFTAPASDGLTRPDGDTGNYFNWLGSDGKLYEPGDNVSADVTRLTAQFDEQFTLTIGDTYWFDLSGVGIPGTANSSLPDTSLHYVPFTYAGTVDAYKLTSEMVTTEEYAQKNEYVHSLFVADYVVTHTVGWDNLDGASLIFGKGYAAGSVDYMLRAPSTGSDGTGSGNSRRGTPQSNEWDRILDKDDGYIKNCGEVLSWGQDTASSLLANRARRGYNSARNWSDWNATWSRPVIGFRPVLEVLNPDTLSSDGLKAVTLDLGGGKLGGSSEAIQIIVKNGESFTAPASDGLTRPDGDTGSYFMWLGSDGKIYAPGDTVPAVITKLTAQFVTSSHSVTITTDTLPNGKVGGAYSHTLTADGTAPITWSIDSGNLPAGLSLNKDTGEISGTPTAEGTSTFTVKAENSTGSVTKELSITIAKAAPTEYTVRFNANGGGGTMEDVTGVSGSYTLPACGFTEPEGKQFKGWSTSADGSVISSTTYEVSSDTTFYAIWESKEYSIIVTDGKATNGAGSEISKAAQGTKVTLTANAAPDGKEFDKWVVESGSTTLEDANSETTTFIMPDSEVSVKATYKNAPVTTYSLTTQVNGGHGTISASKTGLTAGSTETITFTPEVGYEIDTVTVNGTATSVSGNTLNVTMNENKTVIVTYKATGGGEHTHSHGSEWKNDADNHWHECSCGDKKDTAAHTAGEWIIDTPATATTSGSKHKECTVCGYTMATETIPATGGGEHTHSHGSEWKNDADNHWHECSCGDKKDTAAHTAGEWIIDTPATATTSGSKHKECTVCGYTMATETIPTTGGSEHSHSYVSKVTKAATTTEEGITTYTCSKCGHSYTQTIAKIKSDDSSKGNDKDNGTPIKPYIKGESGKEGWDVIKPELEEAKSGDTVTVAMNGTTVVPKDILDSIKGKDVTLVLDMENGISWKINGKEITDAAGDIDFDVTVGADAGKSIPVDVINNVTGERYSMNLTLAYDGEFGFTATLTVNMESKNAGLYANLFYYNEQTGELEFISAGQINADGNVELEFTHASDYTIVVDAKIMSDNGQADNKADETIPAPKTDDSTSKYAWNNTIIIIIGICIILIVFGAVIYVRKKDESKEE